ncbi:MAG: hypothetical protein ABII21_03455 [bacterium]
MKNTINYLMLFKYKFVFGLVLVLLSVSKVKADYTFFDDFSDGYDNNWVTISGHPTPSTGSGNLEFNSVLPSNKFAYIAHSGLAPIRTISFNFKYQLKGADFGSGIILTENIPLTEISPPNDSGDYVAGVYVLSNGKYYVFTPLCAQYVTCGLPSHPYAVYELNPDLFYKIKFEFSLDNLKVYIDDILVKAFTMNDYRADGVFFGNSMITSTDKIWQRFWVDDVSINYSDLSTVSFPHLSQLDLLWAEVEYDTAHEWAPLLERGIGRWGCALTSAAMILQKNGIKMTDGTDVNPDKLNTWMLAHDGFIGPGLVNWLAITRFAKESFDLNTESTKFADTKLEFARSYTTDGITLPAILGIPGHFVVAHDTASPNWIVNDPAKSVGDTTMPMTTTVKSVNRFIPSSTDLSYFIFATKTGGVAATLTDEGGTTVPTIWLDESITDALTSGSTPTWKTAYIPKPSSGKYRLHINNSEVDVTDFEIYLYDRDGNHQKLVVKVPVGSTVYEINFDKDNAPASLLKLLDETPPSIPTMLGFTNPNVSCGGYTNSKYVTVDWSDATDNVGVTAYDYQVDYPLVGGSGRGVWNTTFTTSQYRGSLNEGVHFVKVRAVDAAGNKSLWSDSCAITYDSIKPILASKTEFGGWYNQKQKAYFHYTDLNMPLDYQDPSCTIESEGVGVSCSLTPNVCDIAGNCNTEPVTSNLANIDLTAPSAPKNIFVLGWRRIILAHWNKVMDAVSYNVYIGTSRGNMLKVGSTEKSYWHSVNMKPGFYFVGVTSVDQAGNESKMPHVWRVWVFR